MPDNIHIQKYVGRRVTAGHRYRRSMLRRLAPQNRVAGALRLRRAIAQTACIMIRVCVRRV